MDICGKTMLERVIDRTRMAVENVVVATPDEEISDFCETIFVPCFVGSENDVLDRYYQCAKSYGIDNIVRITADNPLMNPEVIKLVVDTYMEGDYDYVSNCRLKTTYPIGWDVEVFSFNALKFAHRASRSDYEREHVTPYIYNHPEYYDLLVIENEENWSEIRMTVDNQEDLEYVRDIYSKEVIHGTLRVGSR